MPSCQAPVRAIVWMDAREACLYRLHADAPFLKVTHKAGTMGAGRPLADCDFFDRVIDALRGTRVWSLAGPDKTRDQFLGYLEHYKARDGHIARLLAQLAGVSEMARPSGSIG